MRASKITGLDFYEDLTSSYVRKRFFWGVLGLVAVLALVLLALATYVPATWPTVSEVIATVITDVISGAVIIFLAYLLYVYFIGVGSPATEVTVTRPQDIQARVMALPLDTSRYFFWGRSGAFFRGETLRKLDEEARKHNRSISVEVLLPDPNDSRLVESYREICVSLGEDERQNPLLPNVLATSMVCATLAGNNRLLEVRLFLSHFLPGFRLDLSDNGAILTQDDKTKPALWIESGTESYEMFRNTMLNERRVSREVTWDDKLFRGVDLEDASRDPERLLAFGVEVPDLEHVRRDVGTLIKDKWHRYQ